PDSLPPPPPSPAVPRGMSLSDILMSPNASPFSARPRVPAHPMEKLDLGTFRGLGSLELEEMSRQADYSGELHRRLSDVGLFDPQKVPQNAAPRGPPLLNQPLTNGYLLPPYTPPDEPLTWAFGVVEEPLQPLPEHFSFMSPDELYNQKPNP